MAWSLGEMLLKYDFGFNKEEQGVVGKGMEERQIKNDINFLKNPQNPFRSWM